MDEKDKKDKKKGLAALLSAAVEMIGGTGDNQRKAGEAGQTGRTVREIPLPMVILNSPYDSIPDDQDSFESRAKRCAMGDLESMLWMFHEFRGRLTEEYKALEKECAGDLDGEGRKRITAYLKAHEEEGIYLQAAHLWLNRAALYGSEKAKRILEENDVYRNFAYFNLQFQQPGERRIRGCRGAVMREMGFLDFVEDGPYDLESMNDTGIYVCSCYVSYDGPDETGFGMEDEDDYYFYDEFFRLLFVLREWSARDVRNNQSRIQPACRDMAAEKQKERDAFWSRARADMERYHSRMSPI